MTIEKQNFLVNRQAVKVRSFPYLDDRGRRFHAVFHHRHIQMAAVTEKLASTETLGVGDARGIEGRALVFDEFALAQGKCRLGSVRTMNNPHRAVRYGDHLPQPHGKISFGSKPGKCDVHRRAVPWLGHMRGRFFKELRLDVPVERPWFYRVE